MIKNLSVRLTLIVNWVIESLYYPTNFILMRLKRLYLKQNLNTKYQQPLNVALT